MQLAVGVSVALHAVAFSVRIVDPQAFNRVFQDTPLEVILVNARSDERPEKARAIAQASLAGGGDAAKGRATTPLPPSFTTEIGDPMLEDAQRKLQNMQEQQALLLAQVKRQLAALPLPDPKQASTDPDEVAREERRRQMVRLLAEIERRISIENARPKKRYISPATREEAYAIYYDSLRRAIENRGTDNFPEIGGKKMYGELSMMVTINFDGQVLSTEVVESSGNSNLDRRAEAIAKGAGPFGLFTPAMRRQAEQIVVVSRFKFTRDETLETRLSTN